LTRRALGALALEPGARAVLSCGDLVKPLVESLATDFFLSMLNPSSRGAHFRFSTFDIAL